MDAGGNSGTSSEPNAMISFRQVNKPTLPALFSTRGARPPSRNQNLFTNLDAKGLDDLLKSRPAGRLVVGGLVSLDLLLLESK
jgi:hypothetical protein